MGTPERFENQRVDLVTRFVEKYEAALADARIRELEAGVACWVKQLGRRPIEFGRESGLHLTMEWDWDDSGEQLYRCYRPNHRAGADPSEWPEDLRVQEDAE